MAMHPLSFSEVLEDEYRYFFGEVKYEPICFERKQVRELGDLKRRIELIPQSREQTRWHVLADAVAKAKGENAGSAITEDDVVRGLNQLLEDEMFLEDLLKRDGERKHRNQEKLDAQLRASESWRELLDVPVARRLLLIQPELQPLIAGDPDVIECFAGQSAAIRLLLAEGMEEALRTYPALLSTIADNNDVEHLLLDDDAINDKLTARQRRDKLRAFFSIPPRRWWFFRAAPDEVLRKKSYSKASVRDISSGGDGAAMEAPARIPEDLLARFNAILIETVYSLYVADRQKIRSIYAAIHKQGTAALCLSGGGIRSATFNLGVLQGLADHRMLNRMHYLSTVSGGGYIGSWFSSWIRRHHEGAVGVAKDLSREPSDPLCPEVQPIQHLREYSAYLAPRATAFSLDSWTLIVTYVRNLLLNWTMLLPLLAAVLALPRIYQALVCTAWNAKRPWAEVGIAAAFLLILASVIAGMVRPATSFSGRGSKKRGRRALALWLLPLIASGFLFCIYWTWHKDNHNYAHDYVWVLPVVFAAGGFLGSLVWRFRATQWNVWEIVYATVSGAIGGLLLWFAFDRCFPPVKLEQAHVGILMELYVCFGVPLYLLVFFLMASLNVGFSTRWCRDYDREWSARGAAALFVYGTMHALGTFAVLVMPVLIFQAPEIFAPIGGLSAAGVWLLRRLAKSVSPEKESARAQWLTPSLHAAAAVALIFIVALISILTSKAIAWMDPQAFGQKETFAKWLANLGPIHRFEFFFYHGHTEHLERIFGGTAENSTKTYIDALRTAHVVTVVAMISIALAVAFFMSWVLNVNVYSMHGMYRNRLIRAFLGASRWERYPDAFTGFDPQDNVEMWKLRPQFIWSASFLDFDRLAEKLAGEEWWKDPKVNSPACQTARAWLAEYLESEDPKKRESEGELRAAVADAINELMRTRDLRRNVPAPSTLKLIEENRAYLEDEFDSLRKCEKSPTLEDRDPMKRPERPDMPQALIKACNDGKECPILTDPPLHVLCTALNLVRGKNLAWQERKAAPFSISPLHTGSRFLGYRDSAEYARGTKAGISLGTAMAISGAAVSPNRGAESSPTFTFLMTLFNARLGWWFGNPRKSTYTDESLKISIFSLLREALGRTDENHRYVYLSDGGHFDNLGLYEMVLRRCKFIIVCDASADSSFGFGDLANAVRKIRVDTGIPIDPLTTKSVGPQKDERYGKYCAFGHIRYQDVDGGREENMGYLLYIKPCVFSECPVDVRNYAKEHHAFPHETTADQFFSESQFESYRALGRYIIGRVCGDNLEKKACASPNVPVFFANAWAYVHEAAEPVGDLAVQNVSDVVRWMQLGLGDKPKSQPKATA